MFKFTKCKCKRSRLHLTHAKAMSEFYTPSYKVIKKVLNGRSVGYWICSKFITLNNLRQELELIPKDVCPF